MKTPVKRLSLSISFLSLSVSALANELTTESWNFASPDMISVKQSSLLIFCEANPSRCPDGLRRKYRGYGGGGRGALYDPSASSTANHTSVVITGDGNNLNLTAEQSSENDSINADLEGDATIDNQEVLNLGH